MFGKLFSWFGGLKLTAILASALGVAAIFIKYLLGKNEKLEGEIETYEKKDEIAGDYKQAVTVNTKKSKERLKDKNEETDTATDIDLNSL